MDSDDETEEKGHKETTVNDTNYKAPTISQLSGVVPPPVPDIHSFVNSHFQVILIILIKYNIKNKLNK